MAEYHTIAHICYKCKQVTLEEKPEWREAYRIEGGVKIISLNFPVCTECRKQERRNKIRNRRVYF